MIDIKSLSLQEITELMKSMGQPAFRGKQVFTWLHKGVRSFEEMSNLPKVLRDRLAAECMLTPPQVARKQVSQQDGTMKYLIGDDRDEGNYNYVKHSDNGSYQSLWFYTEFDDGYCEFRLDSDGELYWVADAIWFCFEK